MRSYSLSNSINPSAFNSRAAAPKIKIPKLNLEIQGHTNGTNPKYKGLDLRRAEKVKDLLIENGVDPDRLSTVGMGGDYPIVAEESRESDPWGNEYNANMRVEIKIRK